MLLECSRAERGRLCGCLQLLPHSAPQHTFRRRLSAPGDGGEGKGVAIRMNALFLALELGRQEWMHHVLDRVEADAQAALARRLHHREAPARQPAGRQRRGDREPGQRGKKQGGQAGQLQQDAAPAKAERLSVGWLNDQLGRGSTQTILLRYAALSCVALRVLIELTCKLHAGCGM